MYGQQKTGLRLSNHIYMVRGAGLEPARLLGTAF